MAAYWEYVRLSRTSNPNWFIKLATLSDTAILREMAVMNAQQLDLQIRQAEMLRLMSMLLANMQSMFIDENRSIHGYPD
jgi:hypothetical protein